MITELAEAAVRMAAHALGIMMVFTDMSGAPITEVANPCRRFEARAGDPDFVAECAAEWRDLANDPDLRPRFRAGCTDSNAPDRSCVRVPNSSGWCSWAASPRQGRIDPDLFVLTQSERQHVLAALPETAALLSRIAKACGTIQKQRSTQ